MQKSRLYEYLELHKELKKKKGSKNIHNCPKLFGLNRITFSFNFEVQCDLDMCEICEIHSIV